MANDDNQGPRVEEPADSGGLGRSTGASLRAFLAINSSTGALLGAIVLVCMGSELWSQFLPKLMRDENAAILTIACYGVFRDFLEAVNYLLGGWLAGRFNTRRGLLLFNVLPLVGLVILISSDSPYRVFLAIPFVFIWDSLAGPALLTVVGDSLPSDRRAMAFSLQSLFRRGGKMLAYGTTSLIILATGLRFGLQTAFAISMVAVLASLAIQIRFQRTASKDSGTIIHQPLRVLRGFHPQLKRLLAADIFARLAEGMPRELIIVFIVAVLMSVFDLTGPAGAAEGAALFGGLRVLAELTSGVTYLPMGAIASRPGFGKRPYIGLTFFFFAAFPAVLAGLAGLVMSGVVPQSIILAVLGVAFVFMGLREIGEPARKAMIVDLIEPAQRTQAIGIYWSCRSVAVMLAPLVGGAIWVGANLLAGRDISDPTGPGPYAMLAASSLCGIIGVIYYYARFAKGSVTPAAPAEAGKKEGP